MNITLVHSSKDLNNILPPPPCRTILGYKIVDENIALVSGKFNQGH
jgi:hypothetical protein